MGWSHMYTADRKIGVSTSIALALKGSAEAGDARAVVSHDGLDVPCLPNSDDGFIDVDGDTWATFGRLDLERSAIVVSTLPVDDKPGRHFPTASVIGDGTAIVLALGSSVSTDGLVIASIDRRSFGERSSAWLVMLHRGDSVVVDGMRFRWSGSGWNEKGEE